MSSTMNLASLVERLILSRYLVVVSLANCIVVFLYIPGDCHQKLNRQDGLHILWYIRLKSDRHNLLYNQQVSSGVQWRKLCWCRWVYECQHLDQVFQGRWQVPVTKCLCWVPLTNGGVGVALPFLIYDHQVPCGHTVSDFWRKIIVWT